MNQENSKYIYIKVKMNRLQEFFAVLAYVEQYPENTYVYDDNNKKLLSEGEKYFKIKKIDIKNLNNTCKIIEVIIEHSKPLTKLTGFDEAFLIFPKLIIEKFYIPFAEKDSRLYFRGLFTFKRFYETVIVFLIKRDFQAIKTLTKNLIKFRAEFLIETSKVYFLFSSRGRKVEYKFLDEDYYKEMARFKFIFCPKGDFVWTYRFFEAIQTGGIPYSFSTTNSYKNFFFLARKKNNFFKNDLEEIPDENIQRFKRDFFLNKKI